MTTHKSHSRTDPMEPFKGIVETLGPVSMAVRRPDAGVFVTDTARIELAGRLIEAFDRRVRREPTATAQQSQTETKKA